MLTRAGGRSATVVAVAVAAVAIAGLAAAPGMDAPWAAHAQTATQVKVGALVANASDAEFTDVNRTKVIVKAVADFNAKYSDINLTLTVNPYMRTEDVKMEEPGALIDAYDAGNGPRYYIGPTTSQGLTNVRDNATTKALLDGDNVLLVSPSSEAPSLIGDDNIFRLAFNVARQGNMLVDEAKSAGIKSYIVVARNDTWGRDLARAVDAKAAQEGLNKRGQTMLFDFTRNGTYWAGIVSSVEASVGTVPDGEEKIGVFFLGYDESYPDMAAAATPSGSSAIRANTAWFAPSTTIEASKPIANDTVRTFSAAVGLTAPSQDLERNALTTSLDTVDPSTNNDFFKYSAYDSVFVLGNAIRMAMAAGEDVNANVSVVKKYMAAAAMNYTGGALGDSLLLDGNGDLRAPDSFTIHKVTMMGEWSEGVPVASTVTQVGALLALDSTDYADNKARDTLLQAAADYNSPADRDSLVKLITYDITDPADSDGYVALDALTRAYDNGNGPSVYIGPSLSSNIEGAVLDYANANDIFLLGYASESESLSIAGDNLFRTAISTARQGHFMAQVMSDAGVKSVVTVVRDDAWGRSLNASIVEALASNGLSLGGAVGFAPATSDWNSTLDEIAAAIGDNSQAGVAFVGVMTEQDSLATAAMGNAALTGVPWFVTPSGYYENMPEDTRNFARAVEMTAIRIDVEDTSEKMALDARVPGLTFYEYAAYDALFILGNTIGEVVDKGKSSGINATDMKPLISAQADAYEGVLGDIALNSKGDLRSPDRFAVWKVDGTSGMWTDTGVRKSTPVADIGAIVILESANFDDSTRLAAMRLAVDDYNAAAENGGPLYLNLREVKTSLSPGAATATSPSALDAVTRASSDIKYYIGPSTSGNSQRVLAYADANGLTLISPSSTAPSLAIEGDALFRLVPNDSQQGKVLADIVHNQQGQILASLINQDGHEHVVMVVRNDTWGMGLDASTSGRLGVHEVDITRIVHEESDADWSQTAREITTEIDRVRTAAPGDPIAVLHIGFPGDFVSLAAQASPAMRSVPWFGTDGVAGTRHIVENETARQFADDVNLTATKFDVPANAKFDRLSAALDSQGIAARTIYTYSAYDSVFVMARAIEAAMSASGDGAYTPADVRSSIRAAASDYEGVLGDIELNRAGDLRTPNSYAAWTVEGSAWRQEGDPFPPTPVFDVGALLMLDNNPIYTDDLEKAAMDIAIDDFNTEHELVGDFYLNLAVQKISIAPSFASPDPDALTGLMNAYANGDGPSLYVGPSTSGNTGRVLGFANDNDIVLISHSSTAPSLALPDDNLFRMVPPDSRQGGILAGLIADDGGVTDLVMAVRGDTWGRGVDETTSAGLGSTAVTRVSFAESDADWPGVAASLGTAIDSASASAAAKPQGRAAVLFIGFDGDFNSIAAQASSVPSLGTVSWFGPDGIGNSQAVISNATSLAFAKQVDMTTVIFTVLDNDVKARLDPTAVYGPSAYDTVRIMGDAIKAAYNGSGSVPPALDVRAAIPAAADAYTGALGDVILDANGDLLFPDTYGIYTLNKDTDMWMSAGAPTPTPVVRIGALLAIDSTDYPDNAARDVLRQAVVDYNSAGDRNSLVKLVAYDITDPADSGGYVALDALTRAYAGGTGPSVYVGPSLSSNVEAVLSYANANDILLLGYASESESLSIAGDNLFRTAVSTDRHGRIMAQAMADAGVRSVVAVVRDDAWGRSLNTSIAGALGGNGLSLAGTVMFPPNTADWTSTMADIASAIGSNDMAGVAFVGVRSEQDSLAAAAQGNAALTAVPWFVTPSGFYQDAAEATRSFAGAVNMTAIVNDVGSSPQRAALDARVEGDLTFYEYAAYDGLFILANSIAAVVDTGKSSSINATDLKPVIPAQADAYEGILGDIALDASGDLGSPDSFAVWRADAASGMWTNTGVTKSTPIVRIGALLAIDNADYQDNKARDALRQASADFNAGGAGGDRAFYVSLATYDITDPADSGGYVALDALTRAHANGTGPSVYIGPSLSSNVGAVLPYANANDILLLGYASEAASLSIAGDNLFRTAISTARQGPIMAEIMDNAGVKSVVTVVRDDAWGRSLNTSIAGALDANDQTLAGAVAFAPSTTNWDATIAAITSAIGSNENAGVVFVGVRTEQDSLASAARGNAALTAVPWFVTPSGYYTDMPEDTRSFASAARMTAIVNYVEDSAKKAALDARVPGLTFYEYAAYDALFILGNSIGDVVDSGKMSGIGAADLKPRIPAQADEYYGVLGNIMLDEYGDLLSPNTYGVYTISAPTNMWRLDSVYPMQCGVSLGEKLIPFGNVNIGDTQSADQTIRSAGRMPLSMVSIAADPWMKSPSGSEVLPAGATSVAVGTASPMALSSTPQNLTGINSTGTTSLVFSLDTSGAASGDAGEAMQTVRYIATCQGS